MNLREALSDSSVEMGKKSSLKFFTITGKVEGRGRLVQRPKLISESGRCCHWMKLRWRFQS